MAILCTTARAFPSVSRQLRSEALSASDTNAAAPAYGAPPMERMTTDYRDESYCQLGQWRHSGGGNRAKGKRSTWRKARRKAGARIPRSICDL